jgi:hypothetical protein
MMTGVLGAGLPLPSTAMPAESGESADPAGGQSFLAALAAAVAAPVLPPEPALRVVVVVPPDVMSTSDGTALDAGDEAEASRLATERPDGVEKADHATDAGRIMVTSTSRSADALAVVMPSESARSEHAAAGHERSEPAGESVNRAIERAADIASDATDEPARHEPAVPADPDVRVRTPGQGDATVPVPATPSMHASAHALAAPPRRQDQGGDAPMADAGGTPPTVARPASTAATRQPASAASATAAGVLAAMHVARESSVTAPPPLDDAVVTVVASGATAVPAGPAAIAPLESARDIQLAVAESIESSTAAATRSEPVVARPVGVVATGSEGGTAAQGEHGRGSDREQPRATVVALDVKPEQSAAVQVPWLATTTPSTETGSTNAALPAAAPAADAPPARVATSHVTVELDPAQSGAERVRVAVRGDVVHATVVTDGGGVEAMRPQLEQLRHALEGQGFREAHVQVRTSSGEVAGAMPSVGIADLRPRAEAASRTPDGSSSEQQQPRGRHRGQDQSPPESRHHEHDEEML